MDNNAEKVPNGMIGQICRDVLITRLKPMIQQNEGYFSSATSTILMFF